MKNIIITNLETKKIWGDDRGIFIPDDRLHEITEKIESGIFGKPERWVREKNLTEFEKTLTPILSRLISTPITKSIVSTIRDTIDQVGTVIDSVKPAEAEKEVLLPAEFTVEIRDADQDPIYRKDQLEKKKRELMGNAEAQLDYIYQNGLEKWIVFRKKIDDENK